jgi:GH43 family beta-xylosidase
MNRSTRAQRFTWNADGTPNFGTPVSLGTPLAVPSGEPAS